MPNLSRASLTAVRELVDDLVAGRFGSIEADGRIGRLTQSEIRRALDEYGRTLVPLPNEAIAAMEILPSNLAPRTFAVDVPLWTAEEGRSDLTLSLTVVENDDGAELTIDDLHVL
jgi:hypothetical protein